MLRKTALHLMHLALFGVAAVSVIIGIFLIMLARGPIAIDVLTEKLEQRLNAAQSTIRIDIGETVLVWEGWKRPISLISHNIQGFNERGAKVASIPQIGISIHIPSALIGRLKLTRFEIMQPRLHLVRGEDGRFQLNVSSNAGSDKEPEQVHTDATASLLRALLTSQKTEDMFERLRHIRISQAEMTVLDRQIDARWQASPVDINLFRNQDKIRAQAWVEVETGDQVAKIRATLDYDIKDQTSSATAQLADISPFELAQRAGKDHIFAFPDMRLSGNVNVKLGQGFLLEEASLSLVSNRSSVRAVEFWDDPLVADSFKVKGNVDFINKQAVIEELRAGLQGADGNKVGLFATGSVGLGPEGADINGNIVLNNVKAQSLDLLWPKGAAPGAREWVTQNLIDGTVNQAQASFDVRVPDVSDAGTEIIFKSFGGKMTFTDISADYFNPLPVLSNIDGQADFDLSNFYIEAFGGEIRDLEYGVVRAEAARINISGLDQELQNIDIDIDILTPIEGALDLIDHDPLGYPSKLGIKPEQASGAARLKTRFQFPLIKDLYMDDVVISVEGYSKNARIMDVVSTYDAEQGDITIQLDNNQMSITGKALLEQVPIEFNWQEYFSADEPINSQIHMTGSFDKAARQRMNLDVVPFLDETIDVIADYTAPAKGNSKLALDVDITPALLDLSFMGWQKKPGTKGNAELVCVFKNGDLIKIDDVSVQAGNLSTRGRLTIDPGSGRLDTLIWDQVRHGKSNYQMTLTQNSDDSLDISLSGKRYDASYWMKRLIEGGEPSKDQTPVFRLKANLGQVDLLNDKMLNKVNLTLAHNGKFFTSGSLQSAIGGAATLEASIVSEGDETKINMYSTNGGSALRALNIIDTVVGGEIEVKSSSPHDRPSAIWGKLKLKNYRLTEAPMLAKVLNAAIEQGADQFDQDASLNFNRLETEFSWVDGVLNLNNGRNAGGDLGITFDGWIQPKIKKIDMAGTVVPAYGLNKIFGEIPILGDILLGGEGEGLFAATYRVKGVLPEPDVSVNPLAALAPGFLRTIFFLEEAD